MIGVLWLATSLSFTENVLGPSHFTLKIYIFFFSVVVSLKSFYVFNIFFLFMSGCGGLPHSNHLVYAVSFGLYVF